MAHFVVSLCGCLCWIIEEKRLNIKRLISYCDANYQVWKKSVKRDFISACASVCISGDIKKGAQGWPFTPVFSRFR